MGKKDTSLQELARDIVGNSQDVSQPADEPYEVGDEVRVYLGPDNSDSHHNGTVGKIADVLEDSLGEETERELDSYSYRIESDGEEIDVWFRHRDLVPE